MILIALLTGCDSNDRSNSGNTLPSIAFSDDYQLSSFTLSDDYAYWEIRRGKLSEGEIQGYRVLEQFDEDSFNSLDETQTEIISNTSSLSGFAGFCRPSFCPVYAVAINGYSVTVIDSGYDLTEFFGEIDTEAELKVRLDYAQDYAQRTTPTFYEEVDDGYMVLMSWDTLCQLRGEDLIKVYRDGTIEKIREISRENYESCV